MALEVQGLPIRQPNEKLMTPEKRPGSTYAQSADKTEPVLDPRPDYRQMSAPNQNPYAAYNPYVTPYSSPNLQTNLFDSAYRPNQSIPLGMVYAQPNRNQFRGSMVPNYNPYGSSINGRMTMW